MFHSKYNKKYKIIFSFCFLKAKPDGHLTSETISSVGDGPEASNL